MTAVMIFGPKTVTEVKEKPVPGPTVTVAGPTATVTASPQLPPPGVPQLTGGTWKDALARTVKLEARSAYSDIQLPADYKTWKVCAQEGTPVDGAVATVVLHLAETTCPAKLGDRLAPESPVPPSGSDNKPGTSSGSDAGRTSTGGSSPAGSSSIRGGDSGSGEQSSGGASSSGSSSSHIVHAGSFCSPSGATGVTSAGTPMVCGSGSDGRNRWKRA
ncbi:hypothetical protein ABZ766_13445 [Streptomyces sp. NPDC006670]|uniref:hypothetical protein n=1 Tax=Streptomyces sp. NPDC006670 TaxID=3154476 RepID=UPI0033CC9B74